MTSFASLYSAAGQRVQPSAIRKLVPLLRQPGIVSFAGGWPAAELFPVEEVARIAQQTLLEDGAAALQYGPTNGDVRLIEQILHRLQLVYGLEASAENQLLITTGAQQAIFLLAWVLLDPGDVVVVESPSYVGTIGIFDAFQARQVGIPMDEQGLQTAVLAAELAAGLRPKFIYTIPDFQNPSGLTMSQPRRAELVALAEQYNFLILEDAPYADLRYEGTSVPPIYTLDPHGRTLYMGSFSKIFSPMRLGWLIGPPELVAKAAVAKQQIDLCTPSLTQAIAYRFCAEGLLEPQIERTKELYRHKRNVMLAALDRSMPAGVEWTQPQGGMFLWLTLPAHLNADNLLAEAVADKVAYVIGSAFYPPAADLPRHTMRLNFVSPTAEQIEQGVARLAAVLKRHLG